MSETESTDPVARRLRDVQEWLGIAPPTTDAELTMLRRECATWARRYGDVVTMNGKLRDEVAALRRREQEWDGWDALHQRLVAKLAEKDAEIQDWRDKYVGAWQTPGADPDRLRVQLREIVTRMAEIEATNAKLVDQHEEVERLRAVAEAAKKARGITGNYNQHTAACQDCPCDVCEDFFDLEQDAELELDAVLLALDRNKAN